MQHDQRSRVHSSSEIDSVLTRKPLSRREFLKVAGFAGAGISLGAGLGGLSLSGCGGDEAVGVEGKVFKIGAPLDLSGGYAPYDTPIGEGAQFAAEEINAAGGAAGMTFEVIMKDIKGDKATALQAAQELIDEGVGWASMTCSDPVVALGRMFGQNGIPNDIGDDGDPNDTVAAGEWTFGFAPQDNIHGPAAAEAAYNDLGWRSAYILKSPDDTYSNNQPLYFKDAFERAGGEVLGVADYKVGAGDYSAIVTKITTSSPQPDFIYSPMWLPDVTIFLRQLRAAGSEIPYFGSDSCETPEFYETPASLIDGMHYFAWAWPVEGSRLDQMYGRYEEKTGVRPETSIFGLGYDMVHIVAAGLEKTGGEGGAALRDAVLGLEGIELTTTDAFSLDPETRAVRRTVALMKMDGNTPTFVKNMPVPSYIPEPL